MGRVLIIPMLAFVLVGCSTTNEQFPPGELITDSPAMAVPEKPGANGMRVESGPRGTYVGFDVKSVKDHGIVAVARNHPWKTTATTGLAGWGFYEWDPFGWWEEDAPREPEPPPTTFEVSIGANGDVVARGTGFNEVKVTQERRESGSGVNQVELKRQGRGSN